MTPTPTSQQAYALLHPQMQRKLYDMGWRELNSLQRKAVSPVLERSHDIILSAPTAAGKTEAAWLPVLTDLLQHPVAGGYGAMMLSPLKALINDQTDRLEALTAGTGIDVTPWHGDVGQTVKQRSASRPSGVLVITPESLEAMLSLRQAQAAEMLSALRYLVIDELHSFVGSERGMQIGSLLARLEQLTGGCPVRIGLSATLADTGAARRCLRPDGTVACSIITADEPAPAARLAVKEYIAAEGQPDPREAIADDLYQRLRGSNNLVFTNSRKDAEATLMLLAERCRRDGVPDAFVLHHGSLAAADRKYVEERLHAGAIPTTAICTASMELGVDIGSVQSVAQVGTAGSATTMRQRLGRSGRSGLPPVMRLYSVDEARDDPKFHLRANLVQNIAVTELVSRGAYEPVTPAEALIGVAVQQVVALLMQAGSFYAAEAYELLCRKGPFNPLSPADFAALLKHLGSLGIIAQTASGQIVIGHRGEKLAGSADFYSAFTTPADYTIIERASHRTVGVVQYKPYYGEVFTLGGRSWIVDSVEERSRTVAVSPAAATGKMMFEGTGPDVSAQVVREMRRVLLSDIIYPYLDTATDAPGHLAMARQWFRAHSLDTQPWVTGPDGRPQLMTWQGMRVNRTLALMAQAWLGLKTPYDHLAVQGLTPGALDSLRQASAARTAETAARELAEAVPRVKKERSKHDPYLPDALLDRVYAARRLDVAATQALLASPLAAQ